MIYFLLLFGGGRASNPGLMDTMHVFYHGPKSPAFPFLEKWHMFLEEFIEIFRNRQ
jgi:hypothetical protein